MDFFQNLNPVTSSIGLITQALLGLILFPILAIEVVSVNRLIPEAVSWPLTIYVGYLIITLLLTSISEYRKSEIKDKDKKCNHCGSPIEISEYKCKNPLCGKKQ